MQGGGDGSEAAVRTTRQGTLGTAKAAVAIAGAISVGVTVAAAAYAVGRSASNASTPTASAANAMRRPESVSPLFDEARKQREGGRRCVGKKSKRQLTSLTSKYVCTMWVTPCKPPPLRRASRLVN